VTDLDYEVVAADLARRDALDQGRDASPLSQAGDALLLDTSDLTIDQIVEKLVEHLAAGSGGAADDR
jgi:cytidylate kinase